MAPQTRSATSSPVKNSQPSRSSPAKRATSPQSEPLHILIVPENLSAKSRILPLPCPRDESRKRFLFCPSKGLYEFTKIGAPSTDYRSLLFTPTEQEPPPPVALPEGSISRGYVQKDASFLVATPYDLMFMLLSILPSSLQGNGKVMFQPLDDLFEAQIAEDAHLRYLVQNGKQIVNDAMCIFCDILDAGDETMFRINEEKVARILLAKAEAMVARGLPSSLEEKFVVRALETPVLSIKRDDSSMSTTIHEATDIPLTPADSFESSTTTSSAAPSVFSEASVADSVSTTSTAPEAVSPGVKHLMRLKVALDFIFASYISPTISGKLRAMITESKTGPDFSPLFIHLTELARLRADALASRSLGDFSRKRGLDDEEVAEERADKRKRLEEEEKRKKANTSRGVKELGKVNVTGMKKMSAFFSKKPAVKAKP